MKAISRELGLGGYMSNKEELLEAIEHYDVFTKLQKNVLKIMIKASGDDNKATIPVATIAKNCGSTRGSVYKNIELFVNDRILEILPSSNKKINTFILNKTRLEEIKNTAIRIKNAIG